ncbi:uncharacterized protein [Littorina saxatilis]|uniref:Uncharacterized protein n=1 Tax=Littorina saxatilis TaxID=31220 RepID=A0AAN9G1E9_9CAEN
MASAYLGPESPRPMAVISEAYRGHVQDRLPLFPTTERYSLGNDYEERFFYLLHKYLELDTTDRLCYVGNARESIADRIEEHFCLVEPVRTLVPGHVHYEETDDHKMLPIPLSHVGAEEHFKQLVRDRECARGSARKGLFDKILVHDGVRYLTAKPSAVYCDMVKCLAPGGMLLVIHRPADLTTLPFFRDAQQRLADNDASYMDIVRDLQSVGLDVQWELEVVPVRMPRRKWLAMMRDRYPPQMEIMSDTEILDGLRELTEGVLKYEGDLVEFQDRLLFIKATHSNLENGYPSVQRYSCGQYVPFPQQNDLKLNMTLPPDFEMDSTRGKRSDSGFKFLWG